MLLMTAEDQPVSRDVFPTTMHTWIDAQLANGPDGRLMINRHVMDVYAWPLAVYFQGSRDRWLGEPDEIVQGFFADRLARPEFFGGWRTSGMKLRRWLMNAFCFYLSELRRRQKRDRLVEEPEYAIDSEDDGAHAAMDRAFVVAIVHQAMHMARQSCDQAGLGEHWRVFVLHHHAGQSYQSISDDLQVAPARAAVMARTASRKFKDAIRELLTRDGASPTSVDDEIRELLEISDHA